MSWRLVRGVRLLILAKTTRPACSESVEVSRYGNSPIVRRYALDSGIHWSSSALAYDPTRKSTICGPSNWTVLALGNYAMPKAFGTP